MFLITTVHAQEQPAQLRPTVLAAMKRATEFYRTQVASHGGYVYHYSIDLEQRWGEGEATKDQIWVQPRALLQSVSLSSRPTKPPAIDTTSKRSKKSPKLSSTGNSSRAVGPIALTLIPRLASGPLSQRKRQGQEQLIAR